MAEVCYKILKRILNVLEDSTENPFKAIFTDLKTPIKNRTIEIQNPYSRYRNNVTVPLIDYISIANRALQRLNAEDQTMNYLESVFNMYNMDRTACTGKIQLEYIRYEKFGGLTSEDIFVHINNKRIDIKYVKENKRQGMINVATEFLKRLRESTCTYGDMTFTSLALSTVAIIEGITEDSSIEGGHSNILLILKNNRTGNIKFILYEPHGYDIPEQDIIVRLVNKYNTEFINELARYITQLSDYNVEIMDPIKVQCVIGIQQYMGDFRGLCMLISTFWMFIALGLIKNSNEDDVDEIFTELPLIERCLYANMDEEELSTVLINFGIHVLNDYLPLIIGSKKHREFNNLCIQEYITIYKLPHNSVDFDLPTIKHKRKKERSALQIRDQTSQEEQSKKDNCEPCEKSLDCKSNKCFKNTCRPDGYRGGGGLKNGKSCNSGKQCCSETCKDGKCVANIHPYKALLHSKKDNRRTIF